MTLKRTACIVLSLLVLLWTIFWMVFTATNVDWLTAFNLWPLWFAFLAVNAVMASVALTYLVRLFVGGSYEKSDHRES